MILWIYDDLIEPRESIQDIVGNKRFGDVIVKKMTLEEHYKKGVLGDTCRDIDEWVHFRNYSDISGFIEKYSRLAKKNDVRIIHCFSNFVIINSEQVKVALEKVNFTNEIVAFSNDDKIVAAIFPDWETYLGVLEECGDSKFVYDVLNKKNIPDVEIDGIMNIGDIFSFIHVITGNFESRYFNQLNGDNYILTKCSKNIEKIKAEYTFYQLLPDDMKYWFVQPFNYRQTQNEASYQMERLHMTDLSIKWVHGSMNVSEFSELLDRYMFFFSIRHKKKCAKLEYENIQQNLYLNKVMDRIKSLKEHKAYLNISRITNESEYDIDYLFQRYVKLKEHIENKSVMKYELAIGHGDPCFSNALYSRITGTLKFIDPKGATKEEDLWTDPYYDIAKLSHSVCGRYDFFNSGLYEIRLGKNFDYILDIKYNDKEYQTLFRGALERNGYNYYLVRIYEVSLFLSMLPLHMDNPHKVLGIIINAKIIMDEIERELSS